jgi:hypothetical protein
VADPRRERYQKPLVIVSGDKRVSSAFLDTLREEPSTTAMTAFTRKAPTSDTIVKVDGLSDAIATVDSEIRERARSSIPPEPDIFDTLVSPMAPDAMANGRTDDTCGAAIYQPYVPTPKPPAPTEEMHERTMVIPQAPPVPTDLVPPIVIVDRESFFNPPPLVLLEQPAPRSNALGWFLLAFLLPLGIFGILLATMMLRHPDPVASTPRVKQQPVFIGAKSFAEPPLMVVDVKTLKPATKPSKKKR